MLEVGFKENLYEGPQFFLCLGSLRGCNQGGASAEGEEAAREKGWGCRGAQEVEWDGQLIVLS
ncbi:conserved hypothetical protein [Ricinus communis]|uniref:Uncharacterized protein n=1 Tax=Ricinus communis TaxID=3988 RepID=B9RJT6_RICCO|nr:conserved hypothetical protein [Ricinus communis]